MRNRWKRLDPEKLVFIVSAGFLVFLLGGLFATKRLQPYQMFEDGFKAARQLIEERTQTRPILLEELRYEGDGVTVHDAGAAYEGYTAMQGLFPEGIELRLVDMAGEVIHRWPADFDAVWPNPTHVFPDKNLPIDELHYHTHGMWVLPDGSAVFNFGQLGTVKLDKCGSVVWSVDRLTHHSITANQDGSFWIPAKRDVRLVAEDLLLIGLSKDALLSSDGRYEDTLLRVGADGATKQELSVLRAVVEGQFAPELFDMREVSKWDPTHVNDIEIVTPELAARIGAVSEGDLLVSIRQFHMLAILDGHTGAVKWRHRGPWVRQHDPDITEQGMIEVFSNGDEDLAVDGVRGSSIMSLDPATGETRTIYPPAGQKGFFTRIMGRHQRLPNGNRLITESMPGRVFEVDEEGRVVWEYIKPYDGTHAALIEEAIRYDKDYFTVQDWRCPS